MAADNGIWIGQDGKQYGPYSETEIRQGLAAGRFAADALAWREGMSKWLPLTELLAAITGPPPLPPLIYTHPSVTAESARSSLPMPPSLHWGLVLLYTILTLGIFGMVWPFIQAKWIRRIDYRSNATVLLGIAIPCYVIGYLLNLGGALYSLKVDPVAGASMSALGDLLIFGYLVLYLVAYFGMAGSMRRQLKAAALPLEISGVTLFFFHVYYLQGQLRWLARLKSTGETTPTAPKGVFWATFLMLPLVIAILAVIALSANQNRIVRTQVAEGSALAAGARTAMSTYYDAHHALPADNAAVGLPPSTSISGRYVSSVNIAAGVVTVTFDGSKANHRLRYHTLVFLPVMTSGKITWDCSTYSTVGYSVLPLSCRQ